jgi:hypothetical protein
VTRRRGDLFCTDLLVRRVYSGMESYISPPGIEAPEPLVEFASLVYFYRILRQVSERPDPGETRKLKPSDLAQLKYPSRSRIGSQRPGHEPPSPDVARLRRGETREHARDIAVNACNKKRKVDMGRRGNPNWGKPEAFGPVVITASSFETAVKELKLEPDEYVQSVRLREWARRNKNSKFIPESLLQAWGLEPDQFL